MPTFNERFQDNLRNIRGDKSSFGYSGNNMSLSLSKGREGIGLDAGVRGGMKLTDRISISGSASKRFSSSKSPAQWSGTARYGRSNKRSSLSASATASSGKSYSATVGGSYKGLHGSVTGEYRDGKPSIHGSVGYRRHLKKSGGSISASVSGSKDRASFTAEASRPITKRLDASASFGHEISRGSRPRTRATVGLRLKI